MKLKLAGCVGHVEKDGTAWWGHTGRDVAEERGLCRAYILTQRRLRKAARGFFG